ncbi:hypothetical protein MUK42_25786 [Musa troglodytarum]|uniref:Uncharacterized protein n=1 Tax=Musa troglodytarum TaxID=320322 RepID=A0A9E7L6J7_9LILI|nr:hypothetical protein MUK42_25786 [Musa troglodytarum]
MDGPDGDNDGGTAEMAIRDARIPKHVMATSVPVAAVASSIQIAVSARLDSLIAPVLPQPSVGPLFHPSSHIPLAPWVAPPALQFDLFLDLLETSDVLPFGFWVVYVDFRIKIPSFCKGNMY